MNEIKVGLVAACALLCSLFVPGAAHAQPAPVQLTPAVQVAQAESPEQIITQYHKLLDQLAANEKAVTNAANSPEGKRTGAAVNDAIAAAKAVEVEYLAAKAKSASAAQLKAIAARYSSKLLGVMLAEGAFREVVQKAHQDMQNTLGLLGNPKFSDLIDSDIESLRPAYHAANACLKPWADASSYLTPLKNELLAYIKSHNLNPASMTDEQWTTTFQAAAPILLEKLAHPAPAVAPGQTPEK